MKFSIAWVAWLLIDTSWSKRDFSGAGLIETNVALPLCQIRAWSSPDCSGIGLIDANAALSLASDGWPSNETPEENPYRASRVWRLPIDIEKWFRAESRSLSSLVKELLTFEARIRN